MTYRSAAPPTPRSAPLRSPSVWATPEATQPGLAILGWHYSSKRYFSNTASFVFCGIHHLSNTAEFAALLATFEERVC